MLVLLVFVKPCRLEEALVVEKKTLKERRDDRRKVTMVCLHILYPVGGLKEMRFSSNHPSWHRCRPYPRFSLCTWPPLRERWRKRGETALRYQVILLPNALWLRTQSSNCRELYLFYFSGLIGVAVLSHFPFEVLFQCVANSSNELRLIQAWMGGRAEMVGVGNAGCLTGSFLATLPG